MEDRYWERKVPFEELERASKVIMHTPYGLQDGNGVDVTLIALELERPLLQRLAEAEAAVREYEKVYGHG